MSDWTDELRQEVVDKYLAAEPTAENSTEIVQELADEFEKTPNGIRMILIKAEVYVKKNQGGSKGKSSGGSTGGKRVSKQDAIDALTTKIEELGADVDEDILNRLTGKAAQYFTEVLSKAE